MSELPKDGIFIDAEFGWVVLAGVGVFLVNVFQIGMIGRARSKYNIKAPIMFSEENEAFNCYQRAHQNSLEFAPFILFLMGSAGLVYPKIAAGFGLVYITARIIYSFGYYYRPNWRFPGHFLSLLGGILPMTGLAITSAGSLLGWW